MRKSEKQGRRVLPGLWQLKRRVWIVRAQPVDPSTGKRVNLRRVLEDVSRQEAIEAREALLRTFEVRDEPVSWPSPTPLTAQVVVGDFASSWLERKIARGDLNASTAERYALALDRLSDRIAETAMRDVAPSDIERWMIASLAQYAPAARR
jgi:hypothetical protein